MVSALDRDIQSLTGFETTGAVQTDAAINRGNSGGPLLDARGRVLGINAQIRTTSGEGSGVGFAIPVDIVKRSIDQLRSSGRVRYAYLGVATRALYPQLADRLDLPVEHGALVQEVTEGGPADEAGLRAGEDTVRLQEREFKTGGDIVTARRRSEGAARRTTSPWRCSRSARVSASGSTSCATATASAST